MDLKRMKGMNNIVSVNMNVTAIYISICRLFMGEIDSEKYPLTIKSIILQETSTNLESLMEPITILNNILTNNVYGGNEISNDSSYCQVLNSLFSSFLSEQQYTENQYICNAINAFFVNKQEINIFFRHLMQYCHNKNLLNLIFGDLIEMSTKDWSKKYDVMIQKKNQNLLRPIMLKLFKNVTYLHISCWSFPLSMKALLKLITGTQIKKVEIYGKHWIRAVKAWPSLYNITKKFSDKNFDMQFNYDNTKLFIKYNSR